MHLQMALQVEIRDGDSIDVKLTMHSNLINTCPMALFHGGTDAYSPNGSIQSTVN